VECVLFYLCKCPSGCEHFQVFLSLGIVTRVHWGDLIPNSLVPQGINVIFNYNEKMASGLKSLASRENKENEST
jgi:hypothetical protein